MSGVLPAAVGAVVSDVLSVCGVPGASTVGVMMSAAVEAVRKRRQDNAREILLEELRRGMAFVDQAASIDEWVAVLLRYSRAAQEGAARLNLRLMAKVISGQAQAGVLVADEFLAWADVLASLRREEVILLGTMILVRKELGAEQLDTQQGERLGKLRDKLRERFIPSRYPSVDALSAAELALGRTGLIVAVSGWDGTFYSPSPLLDRLQVLADFQEALREEGLDLG